MSQAIRTILVVLGLAGSYPDVSFHDIRLYREDNGIYAGFVTESLINPSIRGVIDSGYEVHINYFITTVQGIDIVYLGQSVRAITNDNGLYTVNRRTGMTYDELIGYLRYQEIYILTNSPDYHGRQFRTTIRLSINSADTPDLVELWGNKPKLILNFRADD